MADSASPARASGSRLRLEPLTPRHDSARADELSPDLLRPGLRIPALPGHEARVDAFGDVRVRVRQEGEELRGTPGGRGQGRGCARKMKKCGLGLGLGR